MNTVVADNAPEIRPGEVTVALPERADAGLAFIGRITTPYQTRRNCPHQGDPVNGPVCRITVDAPWDQGLKDVARHSHLQILYWMHHARRDLVLQSPKRDGRAIGTFAVRSPMRPNPIASSLVALVGVEGNTLLVRGLDCLDGTPLLDIKPEICPHAE